MREQEEIVAESIEVANNETRNLRRLIFVFAGLVLVLVAVASIAGWLIYSEVRSQAEKGTAYAAQVREACNDPKQIDDLPARFCDDADKVVDDGEAVGIPVPGPQGERGDTGPPPSQADVLAAVALYCNEGLCDGQDGANATASQVASAVARYCDSNGECRGRPGSDGTDGADGSDAPPPTPQQISAAVAEFCGESNCDGPQGPAGPAGSDGTDALPFTFSFTVPGDNPAEPTHRYTIRCTEANTESCEVTREEVTTEPGTP